MFFLFYVHGYPSSQLHYAHSFSAAPPLRYAKYFSFTYQASAQKPLPFQSQRDEGCFNALLYLQYTVSLFIFFFYCSIFLWYFLMILKRRTKQKKKNLRRTCVYDLSKAVPFFFLFLFLPFLSAEELFPLSLGPEGAARVSRFTNRVCRDGSGGSRLRHAP